MPRQIWQADQDHPRGSPAGLQGADEIAPAKEVQAERKRSMKFRKREDEDGEQDGLDLPIA